ncbi:MAG: Dolichyl-phosphate-mannose-protein mannosyltransferase [candidate division BRC1 bacterium ADurb.BinA292]|nr:MAG: Dolichyl-phosphate-mannose-protein mannosyltransferase [candidate division BRC1 bacterium ADurb.BinA292]
MQRPARSDSLLMAALAALAAILIRLIHLERLGISHWDEGEYVRAARLLADHFTQGLAHLAPEHAPPLVPVLISLSFRLFGPYDFAAILVSAVTGGLTVGLVFWILDRAAGRAAAWGGAIILALCPLHLVYSRMALTDATFTCFHALGLLLSLARIAPAPPSRAFAIRLWLNGLLLGLTTAAAMFTKYQGLIVWLSAACFEALIVAAAALRRRRGAAPASPILLPARAGSLLLALAVAWLCWLPWRLFVLRTYGPTAMHEQHGLFIRPLSDLPQAAFDSSLILLAVLWIWARWAGLLAAVGALPAWRAQRNGTAALLGWGLAYGFAWLLYTPFIRLLTPLLPLLSLLGGVALGALWNAEGSARRAWAGRLMTLLVVGLMAFHAAEALRWRSDGYRRLGDRFDEIAALRAGLPLVVRLAHPITFYQRDWPHAMMSDPDAPIELYGRRFLLLVDTSVDLIPASRRLMDLWRPHAELIWTAENDRLPPTIFNPPARDDIGPMRGAWPIPPHRTHFLLYEVNLE